MVRVDDTDAQYPVVVDPSFEQAQLTASDGVALNEFGISVAVSGDTIVRWGVGSDIGIIFDKAQAYVFVSQLGLVDHLDL